jgi:hypothetical protein
VNTEELEVQGLSQVYQWVLDQPVILWLWKTVSEKRNNPEPGTVAHAFNPSTWEAEAGGFLSSRPDWSTKWVPGQPGLYRETLSRKNKTKQNKTKTHRSDSSSYTHTPPPPPISWAHRFLLVSLWCYLHQLWWWSFHLVGLLHLVAGILPSSIDLSLLI